jgi:hypothetical protein
VLFALAAFGLHQLRYMVGYGGEAGESLAAHGHAYLDVTLLFLTALALSIVPASLILAASSRKSASGALLNSATARCTTYSMLLLATFVVQELAEGLLAPGHPEGLEGLVAHGGWIVAPLAALLGTALGLLEDGFAVVERRLAGGSFLLGARPAPAKVVRPSPRPAAVPRAALALGFGLARRPPPTFIRPLLARATPAPE